MGKEIDIDYAIDAYQTKISERQEDRALADARKVLGSLGPIAAEISIAECPTVELDDDNEIARVQAWITVPLSRPDAGLMARLRRFVRLPND